jgi:hypothetical protein
LVEAINILVDYKSYVVYIVGMSKSELRLVSHAVIPGAKVIEIWHQNRLMGTITGADGPGVRIISKFKLRSPTDDQRLAAAARCLDVDVVEIKIEA